MSKTNCPNCGAPIEHIYVHNCPYCKTLLNSNNAIKIDDTHNKNLYNIKIVDIVNEPMYYYISIYIKAYLEELPVISQYYDNDYADITEFSSQGKCIMFKIDLEINKLCDYKHLYDYIYYSFPPALKFYKTEIMNKIFEFCNLHRTPLNRFIGEKI